MDLADIMTVSIGSVEALLAASFRFTQALYDDKDPYKRISGFTGMACCPEWETGASCAIPSARSIVTA